MRQEEGVLQFVEQLITLDLGDAQPSRKGLRVDWNWRHGINEILQMRPRALMAGGQLLLLIGTTNRRVNGRGRETKTFLFANYKYSVCGAPGEGEWIRLISR